MNADLGFTRVPFENQKELFYVLRFIMGTEEMYDIMYNFLDISELEYAIENIKYDYPELELIIQEDDDIAKDIESQIKVIVTALNYGILIDYIIDILEDDTIKYINNEVIDLIRDSVF